MGKLNIFKIAICFISIGFLSSCSENSDLEIDPTNLLIGNWTEPTYTNENITFKRSSSLQNDSYGVSFKNKGVFIEHSSGWCGTAPLVFTDYIGNWQAENKLIMVSMQHFPGGFNWRIVSLTENQLIVQRELTSQEKEHQILTTLFTEIETLANSVSCTDASMWNYTTYGSKACGGPQGYIAYSNKINHVAFLKKIQDYTELEDVYNKKWDIISTCDLPSQPIEIVCENGRPVLKY